MSKIDSIKNNLVCLVPSKDSYHVITSHEKTLCDCEVLEIINELEQKLAKATERIVLLRAKIESHRDTKWFNPITNKFEPTICNYSAIKCLEEDDKLARTTLAELNKE